ncbi:glucose-6-phosphate isomerase [Tenacibaculum piscium]|uniref:Glucose-6-phosphate isomerase n=1 Tax=Tenacibaculum piscium TaxID=1458515 RepID=A0A2H1YKT9_9FLAO|nr:glucose-6-phosphate isomerase [Tenacibaculum piscium]MBE7629388.1 glucose-6-phosphate isomerase [Tenacibaculum piscium]MBE7671259.1 glucose-6-phosphate isomerase [Tenacibaculum piscium]MBE7685399.1 glucose-6-phosphate isomerase [Tenacibaculum piscium]MBE7689984.1 glucose-6-phosphate isomerase [Tenacibaculum piscium]SOS75817.1 Glucose-6-phosphate isomerase [Tenacibaculum piscium]
MPLQNINPTKTEAWKKLTDHFSEAEKYELKTLFRNDKQRKERFSVQLEELKLDFSKNHITQKTLDLLISLAKETKLKDAINQCFSGAKINVTEERAVLHTALRSNSDTPIFVDGEDIKPKIQACLKKMKSFSKKVISKKWKGYTGKPITDIVNIGVGGSDLGPSMVVQGLQFYRNRLNSHFVSNIDGDHVYEILSKLHPETTLFIIVSKSFTTDETITNATTIRNWFLKSAEVTDIAKHFVAVSSNIDQAIDFGIRKKNIFPMWNWVGGRFSLWSAVGLSISLAVGFDNFKELLNGAEKVDNHFKTADFHENIPVILGVLSIWSNNFFKSETEAILPYNQYLCKLPAYLQQAIMESNGKSVDRGGNQIKYQTCGVIWGGAGTDIQHAFMQLLHQGTKLIPADFIGFEEPLHGLTIQHEKLMANYYAQMEALAYGKTKEEIHLELKTQNKAAQINKLLPYKVFEGNRPSNAITLKKLTPKSLGMLIATYEHKIFTQGVIWNIYSFDQFGVELGKELAKKLLINE